jgi:hypothetical protein
MVSVIPINSLLSSLSSSPRKSRFLGANRLPGEDLEVSGPMFRKYTQRIAKQTKTIMLMIVIKQPLALFMSRIS